MSLDAIEEIPECPSCGGTTFRRASMFDSGMFAAGGVKLSDETLVDHPVLEPEGERPNWLAGVRSRLTVPGPVIAYLEDEDPRTVELSKGWSRVGRSASADIRLDDPTVSRRHALIVRATQGIRVLDDRSLNGVFVNGERVDWCRLSDGDEIAIGRYQLHLIEQ